MKKVLIISIIVICLVVGGVIFFLNCGEKGKQIELTYTSNGGVPYRWEYEIEDESIIECVKTYVIKDENKGGRVGAPIYTNYVFKGLKKGTTTITFRYVNIIDLAAIPKFRKK